MKQILPVLPHQVQYAVHVAPVEDAAMDDRPAAFVVATDDLCEVAVEIVPEIAQVGGTEVDVIPQVVGVAAYARAGIERLPGLPGFAEGAGE